MVAKDMGVSKRSGGLGELRDLNKLGGNLEIMNLRYVKNPASEFEAANLKEKQRLQSLTLSWKLGSRYDNNSDGGPDDVENDEEMSLEELRPHINLKWLIVFWQEVIGGHTEDEDFGVTIYLFLFFDFPSQLKILQIENIEDLEFLPEELLTNLTSLHRLYIRYCSRITKVSSALRHLTSLEKLVFLACEELDLSDSKDHSDMRWQYLRSLRELQLIN
ncbi:hypothetical protein GH714_015709 [Hevea brasiliensis]|uniref:R13L1/DRL21-like LRR repeat region domain-containing protein n=1 Tax=Hevea brasiliensis TaxID=3981 RepID=A0A6A6N5H3_HEVBR|nr:hypothetical protein GH714_015709 [Hevea brasiliensis]